MKDLNILIVGVGGQGVILASNILSEVGIKAGYDVKKSEIHGMSQRGGSVSSDIRFNTKKVYSPIIPDGKVDFLLGFEKLETLRYIDMLTPNGVIISSDYKLDPMTVSSGSAKYPENIEGTIKEKCKIVHFFNNSETLKLINNPKALNIFILGALAKFVEIERDIWYEAIKENVPPAFVDLNINAFEEGNRFIK